jgi:hypothetical protein
VEAVSALLDAGTGVRLEVEVDGGRGGGEWFGNARIWNASDGTTKHKSTMTGGGVKENLGLERSLGAKGDEEDEKNKAWRKNYWLAYDSLGSEYVSHPLNGLFYLLMVPDCIQCGEYSSSPTCTSPRQNLAPACHQPRL